jgi:hypothetical protein
VPNDSGYIEVDADGIPQGEWHWDPDDEIWVYEEYPQKGDVVKTGDMPYAAAYAVSAAASALALYLLLKKKRRGK